MWSDDTDLTQLAQRLRVGPRELIEAIGGPWFVVDRDPADEIARVGTLFVGRAGPSVAILVEDGPVPGLLLGVAVGEWLDPGTLVWTLVEPMVSTAAATAQATDDEVADLLATLRDAVDAAYEAKRPDLVVCRYCGVLTGPEHALGEDMCQGCGTRILGIVY